MWVHLWLKWNLYLKRLQFLPLYSYKLEVDIKWTFCSVSRFCRVPHAGDAEPNKHKVQLELGCSPVTDPPWPTSSCFRTWICCLDYFAFEKCSLNILKKKICKHFMDFQLFWALGNLEGADWTFLAPPGWETLQYLQHQRQLHGRFWTKQENVQLCWVSVIKEILCCFHVYISCPCSHLKTDWGCFCVCIHLNAAAGIIPAVKEAWSQCSLVSLA